MVGLEVGDWNSGKNEEQRILETYFKPGEITIGP
jgi:hypothetical protein